MASTSSSPIQKRFRYDVFLSFRGEDTRKNFIDHFYQALLHRGIITYKDDKRIEKGEKISDQLIKSIKDSRFHIIVFSKNYATSSWCLDELVQIMECQRTKERTAFPIFYDVEPTEVRNQSGAVGEAFTKHVGKEGVRRWRNALKEAADLAGWELKNIADGHEAQFIQTVIDDIFRRPYFKIFNFDDKLVGMKARVEKVLSSLQVGHDDVRIIGIKGMGGCGKTTLARAVFDHVSTLFEGKSFVENVREGSKGSGLKNLQKQVLSVVLNDQSHDVPSVSDGKHMIKKMLCSKKVLLVLDDVDDAEQLEALVGELSWFRSGSRIIITTRDEQVLTAHGVPSDYIHVVNMLAHEEATCLFSRYAFKNEIPNQGYEELSEYIVSYANGLPLTLKVLGSFLCGRIKGEWEDTIERLKTIPEEKTLERLELSYIGLKSDQKEIFLDVACILKGEPKDEAIRVLKSCGYYAEIGLKVLEEKSLINTSDDDRLLVHDLIEEMGMNIVRRLHPNEPERHSRLWIREEIEDILLNDLGSEATRSINLKDTNLHPVMIMQRLRNMTKLRLLYVYSKWNFDEVYNDEVVEHLPNSLRSINWFSYPFWCLPKMFQANKLVHLKMERSNISQLWEGGEIKVLHELRILNVSHSNLRTFDLKMTPNLETLEVEECHDFIELIMPHECSPLKKLNLGGCQMHLNLKSLCLHGSKMSNLDLGMIPNLERLDLGLCLDFVELKIPIEHSHLKFLNLTHSKLCSLNLGMTPNLEKLYLTNNKDFVELHMPIECSKLKKLDLSGCKVSNLNLGQTPRLKRIDLLWCFDLVELKIPIELSHLKFLNLSRSKLRRLNLGMTPNLEILYLTRSKDFVELHMPIECSKLKELNLSGSKVNNLNLGQTPHLERLDLEECYYLHEIHAPVGCLKNLVHLRISGCLRFGHFSVKLARLAALELTVDPLNVCTLHPNNHFPKFHFHCVYGVYLPSPSGNIEQLLSSGPSSFTNLKSLLATVCGLQHVSKLTLEGSIPEMPKFLCKLERIEKLTFLMVDIKCLPNCICMLKHLKSLRVESCWLLERLPENLGELECLEELHVTDCMYLRNIPDSICNMRCLKRLRLCYCFLVENLPEELGCLECLQVLDINGTRISELPQSMLQLKGLDIIDGSYM